MKIGRPKGWRLTLEQINTARRLRFEEKWSFRRIAAELKCGHETVQRAIDPYYDSYKRQYYELRRQERRRLRERALLRSGGKVGRPRSVVEVKAVALDARERERRANLKADGAFAIAMKAAIGRGQESAPIGISKQASSPDARFTPARWLALSTGSIIGSSAGQCADS